MVNYEPQWTIHAPDVLADVTDNAMAFIITNLSERITIIGGTGTTDKSESIRRSELYASPQGS